ncbi:hypothetical protein NUW58_g3337 [Xylaria curta]|uniref:Uncharacterized protein n=1 Tax=Xylaria curta TaxID=42375 RepID=A0ACC1PE68_9PEZI|nr:hypothetical protein NUW58_g3337 [Xylaria curta]
MERPLVCKSLRKRSDWAGLVPSLLQSSSPCGNWKELQLDTHDVAIPFHSQRVFRAIFLSPQDIASAADLSLSRIERLYNLDGGQDSGIFFLLKQVDNQQSAVPALMTLQLQLLGKWELPVIPVESVAAVPAIITTLQRQLLSPEASCKASSPAISLLPFCSDREPLAEHTVNILTDTTSDFRDLVDKVSSNTVFESEIAPLLDEDADKFRRFWTDDYVVD